MTERNFGEHPQIWVGIVTNVMDPHQGGRVQVRIRGRHDDTVNIPDSDLPFAQVIQPVTSAARGRMGTAPVGLIAGSRVVGIWLDSDHQYPLILGTVGRAGERAAGQTQQGEPAIDTNVGSIPSATQLVVNNAYTSLYPGRVSITDIDSRATDIDSVTRDTGVVLTKVVEDKMDIPKYPTTGSADENESDVLQILRQIDPNNILSSLPCFTPNALSVSLTIDLGSIAAGFINMLTDAVTDAILELADRLGVNNVLAAIDAAGAAIAGFQDAYNAIATGGICAAPRALNSAAAGAQALGYAAANVQAAVNKAGNAPNAIRETLGRTADRITSNVPSLLFTPIATVQVAPVGYVQEYYAADADPYPGYIRWSDPLQNGAPVFTLRNGQPNYRSATEHARYESSSTITAGLASSISRGGLNTRILQNTLEQATGVAQVRGLLSSLGSGVSINSLASLVSLIPTVVAGVSGVFNPKISVSILPNSAAVNAAVQRFTSGQAMLARRRSSLELAVRR